MLDRLRAYLLMRLGPLPVWAWLLILIAGVAGILWWRKRNGATGSDTSSNYTGPGLAPQITDPPFVTDPQVGGGRQEPGWTGPNSTLPSWMTPINIPPAGPGMSFDPPLSSIPPISVPTLPDFPPLTPTGAIPSGSDGRMTEAQIAVARERFKDEIFGSTPTAATTPTAGNPIPKPSTTTTAVSKPAVTQTTQKLPATTQTTKKLPAKTSTTSKSYGVQA